ncbi:SpoIIE family protein phosphatase [bacterium]|nr:SpoIIE family protein phosphatase [bacterium]
MICLKQVPILVFSLMLVFALTALGQDERSEIPHSGQIDRNPQEAYFEVDKGGFIKEWLVIGSFPKKMEVDFLQSQSGEANIRPYEDMTVTAHDGKTYTWKRYKSQRDWINLQNAMKQLLFSIELAFQSELDDDNKQPSKNLRQAFENNSIFLSQNATISISKKGSRWWIIDRGNRQEYLIMNEDEKLKVYSEPKNVLAYAACNILSPKQQRLEMVMGRYDSVKIWLNGSLIPVNQTHIRWNSDRFELALKKGENRLLIKVGQYVAGTDMQLGFNAQIQNYEAYLHSLELKLTVQRQNPDGRDELTISAHREPVSTIWKLSSLPVQVEIQDEAQKLLKKLQSSDGNPMVWAVPEEVQGSINILATQMDKSGKKLEAKFTCLAHSIVSVIPQVGYWETYDVTDGLGDSTVYSILQDRNGVLWFGSQGGGLCRYDGHTFRTFTTEDGLPSNDIWTIYEDSKGNLWIGTMKYWTEEGTGVCKYDGKTFQTYTTKDGLADDAITAIYEDDRGHLWFGTLREGVSKFDGRTFRNYTTEDGLAWHVIGDIIQDGEGALWFAHAVKGTWGWGGVTRYDGNSFTILTTKDGLASNFVTSITTDAQGDLWFGTLGAVSKYDGKSFVNFTTWEVNDVFKTKSGALWFATWDGVSRYRNGNFQNFTTRDGLAYNWVFDIAEDREGNLWFGTHGSGVSRYDESVKRIPVEIATNIIMDTKENLWFSTTNGLGRLSIASGTKYRESDYDGKTLHLYDIGDGSLQIFGISEDRDGNIWIGTSGGITKYNGEKSKTFTYKDGLTSNNVRGIYEDSKGVLWMGTHRGGVCTYDGKKFVQVAGEKELGEGWDRIGGLTGDSKGNIWFSTIGHGVWRYDDKDFTKFTTEDGLPGNTIWGIMGDSKGNIWFGSDGGIGRYDGKNFRTFTTKDGLAENGFAVPFEDSKGNLWFGIETGGVHKFDGKNFQTFTTDDGLLSNVAWNIMEDKSGNIIFATSRGITIYTAPEEKIPPPVKVTEVVADKVYSIPPETEFLGVPTPGPYQEGSRFLKIPSTASHISFAYYGASFKTKRMRYNYMLEGYDEDWQATWDEDVSYDNLKPGDYTFKVIAINRDLVYSETPATVHLKIVTPFYFRASFLAPTIGFVIILIAALTILSLGYLNRRRQVQAYQQAAVEELQDARQVQMGLMPDVAPPIEGVEIAGKCLSANDVSGDFFDYLQTETPNEIVLVVADVTGKAMKGAMNAVMTDGILRATAREQVNFTPASLMVTLNDVLKGSMDWGMNVTMVIAAIKRNNLTLANAAHHAHPLLRRNGEIHPLKAGGLPLGMRAGAEYTEEQFPLHSGDVLVLMTDGIIEAEDREGSMYSDSGRLEDIIKKFTLEQSAESMVDAVINDAMSFGGDKTQRDDDMTVVVAKVQ